jgi:hypothetical protein
MRVTGGYWTENRREQPGSRARTAQIVSVMPCDTHYLDAGITFACATEIIGVIAHAFLYCGCLADPMLAQLPDPCSGQDSKVYSGLIAQLTGSRRSSTVRPSN